MQSPQLSGVPFLISCLAILPKVSFKYFGCKPKPGLMELIFSSVKTSPALIYLIKIKLS
jgi:hypothetical protein